MSADHCAVRLESAVVLIMRIMVICGFTSLSSVSVRRDGLLLDINSPLSLQIMVICGLLVNNLSKERTYPLYW